MHPFDLMFRWFRPSSLHFKSNDRTVSQRDQKKILFSSFIAWAVITVYFSWEGTIVEAEQKTIRGYEMKQQTSVCKAPRNKRLLITYWLNLNSIVVFMYLYLHLCGPRGPLKWSQSPIKLKPEGDVIIASGCPLARSLALIKQPAQSSLCSSFRHWELFVQCWLGDVKAQPHWYQPKVSAPKGIVWALKEFFCPIHMFCLE